MGWETSKTTGYIPKWTTLPIAGVFDLICFGTHHVHRITHESLIMTYFQCGPLMTCGGFRVGGGVHNSYTFQCGLVGSFTSPDIDTR